MKRHWKKIAATVLVLAGAGVTPIIPQEMDLLYSYQYEVHPGTSNPLALDNPGFINGIMVDYSDQKLGFVDSDGDGTISVSVFLNADGTKSYVQIPETTYRSMGVQEGQTFNPKKTELRSLYQEIVTPPIAKAAIALDVVTDGGNTTGSSLTYAATVTGTNPIMFVGADIRQSPVEAETVSGITYNAVSMTQEDHYFLSSGGAGSNYLFYLFSPATGAHNVVVTKSLSVSSVFSYSASYTGAQTCGSLEGLNQQGPSTPGTDFVQNVTTVTDNDWFVGTNSNSQDVVTSVTGGSLRYNQAAIVFLDSNTVVHPAGATSVTTTRSGSIGTVQGIIVAFTPNVTCATGVKAPWQYQDF